MNLMMLLLLMQEAQTPQTPLWQAVVESLDRSGRAVEIVAPPRERLELPPLAPGVPPLVSFRYFEGRARHRFGELGLVMDDAGH